MTALLGLAVIAARPQSAPAGSGRQPDEPTLQVQAPLVLEDVVVLDSHNQPVHSLKAADFAVTDNGKPVTLESFEEHAAPTAAQLAALGASMPKMPDLGVNVFTNYTPVSTNGPLNILLLDALNTPMQYQANVRQQMLKFVAAEPPGVPLAIFGLSTHLYLLQGFTSDPAVLKAALTAKSAGAQASPLLDNPVAGGPGGEEQEADIGMQMFLQTEVVPYEEIQRTQRTLEAMTELARYLSVLPGRKNLIWFSGAFPLDIYPSASMQSLGIAASSDSSSDATTAASMFSNSPESHVGGALRVMDDLLRRSQIAIYPVDARGLFTDNSMDASQHIEPGDQLTAQQAENLAGGARPASIGAGPGTGSISIAADAVNNFAVQTDEEHKTMNQMAEETGGKPFYNNGDLKGATLSAISLGSNYYTLTYTPPSGLWDGRFHKIGIKANEHGLHLSYRRGYYADNPALESHGKKQPLPSALEAAMMHGGPEPSQLLFDVRVVPDPLTTYTLGPGSHANPKLMKPPYHTYNLDMLMDIHFVEVTRSAEPASAKSAPGKGGSGQTDATRTAPGAASGGDAGTKLTDVRLGDVGPGAYQGALEFTVLVYNANGEVVNTKTQLARFSLEPDRYAYHLAHGLDASESIDVPADGEYFLRIGIRDPASDRVGAVEIPVAALKSKQAMILASTQKPAKQ